MAKIPTPHDSLFKAIMTVPESAKEFLELYLPKYLQSVCKLDTLKLEAGSYIDEDDLHPYMSDVLYSMETEQGIGYVYTLIEHQSSRDHHMAFRLMRYAIAVMYQHMKTGHDKLPLVIPILYYHGKESPYPDSMNWLDMFDEPELAKSVYTTPFSLVDLTVMPDDEIIKHKKVALLEFLHKHARNQRDIDDLLPVLIRLLKSGYTDSSQNSVAINYIFQMGESQDFRTLFGRLAKQLPEQEETIMRIAEQLRREGRQEGRQEGEQIGLQRGRQETRFEMAQKMLLAGMERTMIAEITGLNLEQLESLAN
ncbi:TPA: Rpn family recombination-promoting nuclease/putative transposase [Photobacterium damselae]